MRRRWTFEVLVVGALILTACGTSDDGGGNGADGGSQAATSPTPPPAIVSQERLDVGKYPTTPRPPLGPAGNPALGAVADAQHMADFVIGPWDVDENLIDPYLASSYILNVPNALQQLGPTSIAKAAGGNGFVNGFASARQVKDEAVMINAVLRFADPAAATAASAAMGDASSTQQVKGVTPTVVAIPGHPATVASWYPFVAAGSEGSRATLRSFTPHGSYVLMQFVQSVDGIDAATSLVAKAIDAQGPAIDQFTLADPAAFADVPLDPTGLLARTLPAMESTAADNAVYDARGATHFQSNPVASVELFKNTGTTAVAMGDTNVYQAKDAGAAVDIINSFNLEVSAEGTTAAEPVKALPESHCLAFPKEFYCIAPAGRYAIEARGNQLLDAQQKLAAQYVMLTAT